MPESQTFTTPPKPTLADIIQRMNVVLGRDGIRIQELYDNNRLCQTTLMHICQNYENIISEKEAEIASLKKKLGDIEEQPELANK